MRNNGRITEWNDEKGYGFVTPDAGVDRVFVHVRAFEKRGKRPVVGDRVSYELTVDAQRRANAARLRYVDARANRSETRRPGFPRCTTGLLALGAIGLLAYRGIIPLVVSLLYAGMSVITLIAYRLDKSAAQADRQRTPESTLHLMELLGGWPGALIAQGLFRHKNRKLAFQVAYWVCVAINIAAVAWAIRSGQLDVLMRRYWPS